MTAPGRDERYERERSFHDERYEHEVRGAVQKFYRVTDSSRREFDELLGPVGAGTTVLEYGCGVDGLAPRLAERGAHVTAIDLSPVAIERAEVAARGSAVEGLAGRLAFREMNAEALTFADGSFDVVCGLGILHHLSLDRAYGEIARVLRPEGFAVFIEPLGHNPLINAYRRLTPKLRTIDEHPLRVADFVMAERTFGGVDVSYHQLFSLAAVPFRSFGFFDRLVASLDRLDVWVFDRMPWMRRHAWNAVIRLSRPRGGAT